MANAVYYSQQRAKHIRISISLLIVTQKSYCVAEWNPVQKVPVYGANNYCKADTDRIVTFRPQW